MHLRPQALSAVPPGGSVSLFVTTSDTVDRCIPAVGKQRSTIRQLGPHSSSARPFGGADVTERQNCTIAIRADAWRRADPNRNSGSR